MLLIYGRLEHVPRDLNGDGTIDTLDLLQLANNWLWSSAAGSIFEDIVEDGIVNFRDFAVITNHWTGGVSAY